MAIDIYAHLTQEDYDNEVWKDIPNYVGLYQISNWGRVKSLARVVVKRSNGQLYPVKERIMSPTKDTDGYLRFGLSNNGLTSFIASRLVALAFIDNPENKPEVNHINGVKADNRACNLEFVTRSENELHAFATGLAKPSDIQKAAARKTGLLMAGENHGNCKLSDKDVLEIIRLRTTTSMTLREIGDIFNVHQSTVCSICKGNHRAKPTPVLQPS